MTQQALLVLPALEALIDEVHTAVYTPFGGAHVADRVAQALKPSLGCRDLLTPEQCEADPTRYRQHVLYVDPAERFSMVALVWLPGQATPIHDHIAWCVFGVHQGEEYEIQYQKRTIGDSEWLVPCGDSTSTVGEVAALIPPGDIHRVFNRGQGCAISIHIYGANVAQRGTSVRRCYDLPIK